MLKQFRTFRGGFRFKNYIGVPQASLSDCPIPSRVIIPLKQGFGTEVKSLVKQGDRVSAGEIIGRDDDSVSSPVHSSVSGVVQEIKRMNYFKREVTMVTVATDDKPQEPLRIKNHSAEWWKLSNDQIEELIYLSGASALDREGIPTKFKSSVIPPQDVKHLIIHSVSSEPYNISLDLLLEGKSLLHFFEGVKILKRIMPKAKVHLAINSNKKKMLEQLVKLSSELEWIDIYPLEPKYPQGYDEMLVPTILNQRFPYGYSAANIGVVVLNTQAVISVYKAVVEGMPLIERIVALCGPSIAENMHLKVRIGTVLDEIIGSRLKKKDQARVVVNSLLTGFLLNDLSLPIDKTFSQIIGIPQTKQRELFSFMRLGINRDSYSRSFLSRFIPKAAKILDTNQHGEERPCFSCGYCQEACPVNIIPHLLAKFVKRGLIDETMMKYGIFNCIDCGLCSYVCPSKIPLLVIIKEGQEKLINQGCDQTQCILPYFDMKGIDAYRGVTKL